MKYSVRMIGSGRRSVRPVSRTRTMPTTIPALRRPGCRGEADDLRLAKGQIAIVTDLALRVGRLGERVRRAVFGRG